MAVDFAPELYEKIHSDFEKKLNQNKKIQAFKSKLKKKTATAKDAYLYAVEVGECASYALCHNLTEDNLPDGKLYWNIANRTIRPILEECHKLVIDAAIEAQKIEDEKIGVNLNGIKPEFPKYRVQDFMNRLISITNEDTDE